MAEISTFSLQKYQTLTRLNPNDAEAFFGLAQAYEEREDFAEAVRAYDQAIKLNPRHARAHVAKGFLLATRTDERRDAVREWDIAWNIDPNIGAMLKDPANINVYSKKISKSLEQFNRPTTINPNDAYAHYLLGMAYKFFDKPELALASLKRAMDINPRLWETYDAAGQIYAMLGQSQYALAQFHKAAEANPKYGTAHYNIGLLYDREGNSALACQHLERALELDGDSSRVQYLLGLVYMKLNRVKAAIQMFQRSADTDKLNPKVHFAMGQAFETLYRPDFAIKSYENAITLDPRYAEAYYHLGLICLQMGNLPQAIESLEQCLKISAADAYAHYHLAEAYRRVSNYEKAIPHYYSSIELNPKDAFAHYNLALAYAHTNSHEQAVLEYRKAIELAPREGHFRFNLARSLQALRRYSEAISELEAVLDTNPNDVEAHWEMGNCYLEGGQVDACIHLYQRVLQLSPSSPKAHHSLGLAFLRLDEIDYAFEELQKAVKIDNRHAPSLHLLGVIYLRHRERPDIAESFLRQAIDCDPEMLVARMDLAEAWLSLNNTEAAVNEFEALHRQYPSDRAVSLRYAAFLERIGRFDEAVAELNRQILVDPESVELRVLLAGTFERRNQINLAIDQYLKVVAHVPREVEYLLRLARLYVRLEKVEEAKTFYSRIINIDPDHEEANASLEALFDGRAVQARPTVTPTTRTVAPAQPAATPAAPVAPRQAPEATRQPAVAAASEAAAQAPPAPAAAAPSQPAPASNLDALFRRAVLSHAMNKKDEAMRLFNQVIEVNAEYYQAYLYLGKGALPDDVFTARFLFEQGLQMAKDARDAEFTGMFSKELEALGVAQAAATPEPAQPAAEVAPAPEPAPEEAPALASEATIAQEPAAETAAPPDEAAAAPAVEPIPEVEAPVAEEPVEVGAAAEPPAAEEAPPVTDVVEVAPAAEHAAAETAAPVDADVAVTENLLLAQQFLDLGKYEKARSRFERVLEVAPGHRDAIMAMASICQRTGAFAEAISLLEAHALQPGSDVEMARALGDLYVAAGQPEKRLEMYGRLAAQHPGCEDYRAVVQSAVPQARSPLEQITELQKSLRDAPDSVSVMLDLTRAYLDADKSALAVVQAQKALKLEESSQAYALLGEAYSRMGKGDAAVRSLTSAVEAGPATAADAARLLEVLRSVGSDDLAARVQEQAAGSGWDVSGNAGAAEPLSPALAEAESLVGASAPSDEAPVAPSVTVELDAEQRAALEVAASEAPDAKASKGAAKPKKAAGKAAEPTAKPAAKPSAKGKKR